MIKKLILLFFVCSTCFAESNLIYGKLIFDNLTLRNAVYNYITARTSTTIHKQHIEAYATKSQNTIITSTTPYNAVTHYAVDFRMYFAITNTVFNNIGIFIINNKDTNLSHIMPGSYIDVWDSTNDIEDINSRNKPCQLIWRWDR